MKPSGNTDDHAGGRPARAPRSAAVAARLGLGALCSTGGAALAQQQWSEAPPPRSTDASPEWQRQQPPQDRVRDLMRREGVLPSQEERREELRTLTEVYGEVMPPDRGTVPAPGVAAEPRPRGER